MKGERQNANQKSISTLAKAIHRRNVEKGFCDQSLSVGEFLMLVVSELSEALEADRGSKYAKVSDQDKQNFISLNTSEFQTEFDAKIKDTFEDEIADAVIRLLGMSERLAIDIEWHVLQKMRYNENRPNKHGGKQY